MEEWIRFNLILVLMSWYIGNKKWKTIFMDILYSIFANPIFIKKYSYSAKVLTELKQETVQTNMIIYTFSLYLEKILILSQVRYLAIGFQILSSMPGIQTSLWSMESILSEILYQIKRNCRMCSVQIIMVNPSFYPFCLGWGWGVWVHFINSNSRLPPAPYHKHTLNYLIILSPKFFQEQPKLIDGRKGLHFFTWT